jgi:hypothetical protein
VVKATGPTGHVHWLSAANKDGFRTLATLEWAAIFKTYLDAHVAMIKLPPAFEQSGLLFSVEAAD